MQVRFDVPIAILLSLGITLQPAIFEAHADSPSQTSRDQELVNDFTRRAKEHQNLVKQYHRICTDNDGKIYSRTAVGDARTVQEGVDLPACDEHALILNELGAKLLAEAPKVKEAARRIDAAARVQAAIDDDEGKHERCENCSTLESDSEPGLMGNIEQIAGVVGGTDGPACAPEDRTNLASGKCAHALKCNLQNNINRWNASLAGFAFGDSVGERARANAAKASEASGCGDVDQVGCLDTVVEAVKKSIVEQIQFFKDIGSAIGKGAKEGWIRIKGFFTETSEAEDRFADANQLARQQTSQMIKDILKGLKEPVKFFSSMFDAIKNAAQSAFGCEQWSGEPFKSQCTKPLASWDCASCNQKINTWCGAVSYALTDAAALSLGLGIAAGAVQGLRASVMAVKVAALASRFAKGVKGSKIAVAAMKSARKITRGSRAVLRAAKSKAAVIQKAAVARSTVKAMDRVSEAMKALNNPITRNIAKFAKQAEQAAANAVSTTAATAKLLGSKVRPFKVELVNWAKRSKTVETAKETVKFAAKWNPVSIYMFMLDNAGFKAGTWIGRRLTRSMRAGKTLTASTRAVNDAKKLFKEEVENYRLYLSPEDQALARKRAREAGQMRRGPDGEEVVITRKKGNKGDPDGPDNACSVSVR